MTRLGQVNRTNIVLILEKEADFSKENPKTNGAKAMKDDDDDDLGLDVDEEGKDDEDINIEIEKDKEKLVVYYDNNQKLSMDILKMYVQ